MTKQTKEREDTAKQDGAGPTVAVQDEAAPAPCFEARAGEEIIELMGFKLGGEEYAIDIMRIKEITPVFELTQIPRAPSYILGILSLRGNIIPVFDAKKKIGLPDSAATEKARIIVLKNGEEQVGILVDSITSAAQIPAGTLEPPPPVLKGVEADYIKGVGRYKDRMMIIMNIDKIVQVDDI